MHLNSVHIAGIGTAVPPHALPQAQSRELARKLFGAVPGLERLLSVFDNSGIETRYLAMPPEWYLTARSFPEKNATWARVALELAEAASRRALARAGIEPQELSGVLFASTTGIATPSLDAYLMQRLDMPRHASRLPVWGLGCAGAVGAWREVPSWSGSGGNLS